MRCFEQNNEINCVCEKTTRVSRYQFHNIQILSIFGTLLLQFLLYYLRQGYDQLYSPSSRQIQQNEYTKINNK